MRVKASIHSVRVHLYYRLKMQPRQQQSKRNKNPDHIRHIPKCISKKFKSIFHFLLSMFKHLFPTVKKKLLRFSSVRYNNREQSLSVSHLYLTSSSPVFALLPRPRTSSLPNPYYNQISRHPSALSIVISATNLPFVNTNQDHERNTTREREREGSPSPPHLPRVPLSTRSAQEHGIKSNLSKDPFRDRVSKRRGNPVHGIKSKAPDNGAWGRVRAR